MLDRGQLVINRASRLQKVLLDLAPLAARAPRNANPGTSASSGQAAPTNRQPRCIAVNLFPSHVMQAVRHTELRRLSTVRTLLIQPGCDNTVVHRSLGNWSTTSRPQRLRFAALFRPLYTWQ